MTHLKKSSIIFLSFNIDFYKVEPFSQRNHCDRCSWFVPIETAERTWSAQDFNMIFLKLYLNMENSILDLINSVLFKYIYFIMTIFINPKFDSMRTLWSSTRASRFCLDRFDSDTHSWWKPIWSRSHATFKVKTIIYA